MTLLEIYKSKWFPRIFYVSSDGGETSGVTGFFLIEWKPVISIALLRFSEGSREAFHNHAFNAVTFWLSGHVVEEQVGGVRKTFKGPSLEPKITPRHRYHKIIGITRAWAFTIRGPWRDSWQEMRDYMEVNLTHGRIVI